ncbi:uncharacterized protein VSU04_008720 [Chlamydotis macqueenii]
MEAGDGWKPGTSARGIQPPRADSPRRFHRSIRPRNAQPGRAQPRGNRSGRHGVTGRGGGRRGRARGAPRGCGRGRRAGPRRCRCTGAARRPGGREGSAAAREHLPALPLAFPELELLTRNPSGVIQRRLNRPINAPRRAPRIRSPPNGHNAAAGRCGTQPALPQKSPPAFASHPRAHPVAPQPVVPSLGCPQAGGHRVGHPSFPAASARGAERSNITGSGRAEEPSPRGEAEAIEPSADSRVSARAIPLTSEAPSQLVPAEALESWVASACSPSAPRIDHSHLEVPVIQASRGIPSAPPALLYSSPVAEGGPKRQGRRCGDGRQGGKQRESSRLPGQKGPRCPSGLTAWITETPLEGRQGHRLFRSNSKRRGLVKRPQFCKGGGTRGCQCTLSFSTFPRPQKENILQGFWPQDLSWPPRCEASQQPGPSRPSASRTLSSSPSPAEVQPPPAVWGFLCPRSPAAPNTQNCSGSVPPTSRDHSTPHIKPGTEKQICFLLLFFPSTSHCVQRVPSAGQSSGHPSAPAVSLLLQKTCLSPRGPLPKSTSPAQQRNQRGDLSSKPGSKPRCRDPDPGLPGHPSGAGNARQCLGWGDAGKLFAPSSSSPEALADAGAGVPLAAQALAPDPSHRIGAAPEGAGLKASPSPWEEAVLGEGKPPPPPRCAQLPADRPAHAPRRGSSTSCSPPSPETTRPQSPPRGLLPKPPRPSPGPAASTATGACLQGAAGNSLPSLAPPPRRYL